MQPGLIFIPGCVASWFSQCKQGSFFRVRCATVFAMQAALILLPGCVASRFSQYRQGSFCFMQAGLIFQGALRHGFRNAGSAHFASRVRCVTRFAMPAGLILLPGCVASRFSQCRQGSFCFQGALRHSVRNAGSAHFASRVRCVTVFTMQAALIFPGALRHSFPMQAGIIFQGALRLGFRNAGSAHFVCVCVCVCVCVSGKSTVKRFAFRSGTYLPTSVKTNTVLLRAAPGSLFGLNRV